MRPRELVPTSCRFAASLALLALGACSASTAGAPPVVTPAQPTASGGLPLLPGVEPAHKVASTLAFESLEGPFWVSSGGGYLLFSDVAEQNGPAAHIYRYDPPAGTFTVAPFPVTPTSTNGLALDGNGGLVACERWNGVLSRSSGGQRAVLADHYPMPSGDTLNAPNDVVIRADGNIYFTDTKWGARPGAHAPLAVYRVAPGGALSVAFAVSMPNGVALSPDGRTLYVGSDDQNEIWSLPVDAAGAVGAATVLVDPTHVPGGLFKVPDGICVDDAGSLYVPNNSDAVKAIEVFTSGGRFTGAIPIPDRPSNCSFGGPDRRTLYVTTLHAIYEVRVPVPGLP